MSRQGNTTAAGLSFGLHRRGCRRVIILPCCQPGSSSWPASAEMMVPAAPSMMALASLSAPMPARLPVLLTNPQAARTFGCIDPGAKSRVARARCHMPDSPGHFRTPVEIERIDVGEHHQPVGAELTGKKGTGAILVDHGLDPGQAAILQLDHGNAAPARADHDHILLDQKFDEARFKDFERGRRWLHALPAIGICGDPPAALGCQGACFALGIDGTDRLSRLAKGRIMAINPDLRQKDSDQAPPGSTFISCRSIR